MITIHQEQKDKFIFNNNYKFAANTTNVLNYEKFLLKLKRFRLQKLLKNNSFIAKCLLFAIIYIFILIKNFWLH